MSGAVSMLAFITGRVGPPCWWCAKAVIAPGRRCAYCNEPWEVEFRVDYWDHERGDDDRCDVPRLSPYEYRLIVLGDGPMGEGPYAEQSCGPHCRRCELELRMSLLLAPDDCTRQAVMAWAESACLSDPAPL